MTVFLTRTASLALAFGFFFFVSCTTSLSTLEQAQSSFDDGDYEQALSSVDKAIKENPEQADLLLLKAETLHKLALVKDRPGERTIFYREMTETLKRIGPDVSEEIQQRKRALIGNSWKAEHQAGTRLYRSQASEPTTGDGRINSHLGNAIEIAPDSIDSYRIKASHHYNQGELNRAIETLELANRNVADPPLDMREKHAFLLLEEGRLETAIELYSTLADSHPDNERIKHGLANAYILDGRHSESIQLLRELIESSPDDVSYHQAIATELFFQVQLLIQQMRETNPDTLAPDFATELEQYLNEAEIHYQFVMEQHPGASDVTYLTGAFYKNTASQLFQLAEHLDSPLADRVEELAIDLLTRSVPVWQQLAETNPENSDVWRSIHQIYTRLGMMEEAEEAQSNVNF
ncbi:MAG: tetratricopeptide repeat protein [Balneolaceae bacterium]